MAEGKGWRFFVLGVGRRSGPKVHESFHHNREGKTAFNAHLHKRMLSTPSLRLARERKRERETKRENEKEKTAAMEKRRPTVKERK